MLSVSRQVVDLGANSKRSSIASFMHHLTLIVGDQVGLSVDEIEPESELADLGIDSLSSLSIVARIQEQLGIDVSASILSLISLMLQGKTPS